MADALPCGARRVVRRAGVKSLLNQYLRWAIRLRPYLFDVSAEDWDDPRRAGGRGVWPLVLGDPGQGRRADAGTVGPPIFKGQLTRRCKWTTVTIDLARHASACALSRCRTGSLPWLPTGLVEVAGHDGRWARPLSARPTFGATSSAPCRFGGSCVLVCFTKNLREALLPADLSRIDKEGAQQPAVPMFGGLIRNFLGSGLYTLCGTRRLNRGFTTIMNEFGKYVYFIPNKYCT